MRTLETLASTVVAVAQFSPFPLNSLEARQLGGSDVIDVPVSVATGTLSTLCFQRRGLGFPELFPPLARKPRRARGSLRVSVAMCLGPIQSWRRVPPEVGLWLSAPGSRVVS